MPRSRRRYDPEVESLKLIARARTVELIEELQEIALARVKEREEVADLTTAVQNLTKTIRAKRIDVGEVEDELKSLVKRVSQRPSDGDVIKAISTLLERGWGKPAQESPELPKGLDVNNDEDVATAVRRSMVASALSGNTAAQQVILKMPTMVDVTGNLLSVTPEAISKLSDEELAALTGIMAKLQGTSE